MAQEKVTTKALRDALNAVESAKGPLTKRDTMRALVETSSGFANRVDAMSGWLNTEDAWLRANEQHAEFEERQETWLKKVQAYQAAHDLLGLALQVIAGKGKAEA